MDNTISVLLRGGTGNRLFQIAALLCVAQKTGRRPILVKNQIYPNEHGDNDQWIYDKFEVVDSVSNETQLQWNNGALFDTMGEHIATDIIKAAREVDKGLHVTLVAYFITKWFVELDASVANLMHSMFPVSEHLTTEIGGDTKEECASAFALHVRRTDYLDPIFAWLYVDLHVEDTSNGYYARAMKHFPPASKCYIFTDDVEWCKKQAIFGSSSTHTIHYAPSNISVQATIGMMASCSLGIICSNSTFSWWGAFFNQSESKIVIMPQKWTRNPEWTLGMYDVQMSCAIQIPP